MTETKPNLKETRKKKSEKRARNERFYVRVTSEEKQIIERKASMTSAKHGPTYLRELGLEKRIKTTFDHEVLLELGQLKSELGRLGGLVKAWLSPKQTDIGTTQESIDYLANNKPALKDLLRELEMIGSKIEQKVKEI